MLHFLLSLVLSFVISHSPVYPSNTLNLCNGIKVDNVQNAIAQDHADMWLVRFTFGDTVTIFDSCSDSYRAYDSDFMQVEF